MEYKIIRLHQHRAAVVKNLLSLLPEWFGIPAVVDEYAGEAEELPNYAIYDKDLCIGILVLSYPSDFSTEIHLIAIHPKSNSKIRDKKILFFLKANHYVQLKICFSSSQSRYNPSKEFSPIKKFPGSNTDATSY